MGLLRSWQTPAQLDDDLTKKSRAYLAFALYAHVVMTMIFYSGWPFDNTCPKIPHKHLSREVFKVAQSALNVTADYVYEECDQNPAAHIGTLLAGGSTEQSYMYGHQKHALHLYATVVMFMSVVLIGVFFGKTIVESVLGMFYGSYSAETTAQKKPFSKEKNVHAYIPEMRHANLTYPIVCTSLEGIDTDYCSFEDDGREGLYEAQCVNSKADFPDLSPTKRESLFSKAKYYPAPDDFADDGDDDAEGMAPEKQWKLPSKPKYKKVDQDESSA